VGSAHRFPLRLPRYSAAVPGDSRRARDPDVGHSLRDGRLSREDGAVSRHRLRGFGVGRLSLHGAVRRDADPSAFARSLGTRRLQMSRFPSGDQPGGPGPRWPEIVPNHRSCHPRSARPSTRRRLRWGRTTILGAASTARHAPSPGASATPPAGPGSGREPSKCGALVGSVT
jgi:hypothetical protein